MPLNPSPSLTWERAARGTRVLGEGASGSGLFRRALHMGNLHSPRLEFPFVADLDVLVIVKACAEPAHLVAGVAQLDVAASAGASAALEIDHVIMDIRARRQRSEAVLVGLEQLGAAAPGMIALAPRHREGAVLGEQVRDSLDIAAPYAVAIFERQFANRLAIGQLGCDLFYTLGHR